LQPFGIVLQSFRSVS